MPAASRHLPGDLDRLTSRFVAPLDVAPHVAGAAVDLTLVDRSGVPLDLGTPIDATPEHAGNAVLAPGDLNALLEGEFRSRRPAPPGFAVLTDKERQVFTAVARGLSNTEIAASIFASESTVKTHVGGILRKLDLRDRVQIVVFAHEHGLVAPGPTG